MLCSCRPLNRSMVPPCPKQLVGLADQILLIEDEDPPARVARRLMPSRVSATLRARTEVLLTVVLEEASCLEVGGVESPDETPARIPHSLLQTELGHADAYCSQSHQRLHA